MKPGLTTAALLLALASLWSCGGGSSYGGGDNAPSRTLTSVSLTGNNAISTGGTSQLTATAAYSNGTSDNVTTQGTWTTSNGAVATVSSGGLVTGVTAGSATITASYQNMSGTRPMQVSASVLAQFTVTPEANTQAGSGQCQVNLDGSAMRLRCTLDARASTPNPATTTYAWEIPAGTLVNKFTGSVLDRPIVQCGAFTGATTVPVRITVSSPDGTDSRTQNVTFVKVSEC